MAGLASPSHLSHRVWSVKLDTLTARTGEWEDVIMR